ncbi:MAG: histidinol dehydrogenase [Dehalococcoidia bacterium]|jgi:histidinol dehydrogenase
MKIVKGFDAAAAELRRPPLALAEAAHKEAVEKILADVRKRGDAALKEMAKKFDGVSLKNLAVSDEEIAAAYKDVDRDLIDALNTAAERIKAFHLTQLRYAVKEFMEEGVGQIVNPIERVGVYAPGGTASYPSTVLMTVIPARVSGVSHITVVTPPGKGGKVPPATLVAADIAGADCVFKVGGAGAIAALAYGTKSIQKVDKICGPGNIFVTIAKRLVYGEVDIDGLAGPTETIVIVDETASPAHCALDLLAQAEHDVLSSAIMITTSSKLASAVDKEVERQLKVLERADIARKSLKEHGLIVIVEDMEQAIELANLYAPEHLSLLMRDAATYAEGIRNAGGIFIGDTSPEVLGDYVAGPSHVMPTGGSARFNSPLNVNDFLKTTSVVALVDDDLDALGPAASKIARSEGLTAHARAAEIRYEKGRGR